VLRPLLDGDRVPRLMDIGLPSFGYLVDDFAATRRSAWLWTKILADHGLRLAKPLRRLARGLAGERVDIVVSNTVTATAGALFAQWRRLPHVWCIREFLNPQLRSGRRLASWVTRLSDAVVVPSSAMVAAFDRGPEVFPDGNHRPTLQAARHTADRGAILAQLGLPVDRPVVAQVGRLSHAKGQHVTVEAFLGLARGSTAPPCSLLYLSQEAGDQARVLRDRLESAPPAWREAVRFATFPPNDFTALACADLLVHPSVRPDPFPNAVREAMLLGVAVIASWAGGIPDLVRHGETGWLVEPGDAEALAGALARLLSSPEERSRLARAGEAHAAVAFDIETTKRPFVELFERLAHRRSSDPPG
jgi:glycosyltransferase involved in cell wall biosynthesis